MHARLCRLFLNPASQLELDMKNERHFCEKLDFALQVFLEYFYSSQLPLSLPFSAYHQQCLESNLDFTLLTKLLQLSQRTKCT